MSSHDLVLSSPPMDADSPAAGVLFTNVSPLPVTLLVSLELSRNPAAQAVRAVFRGLHITIPNREHVVELRGPATVLRTTVALYVPAMQAGAPRPVTLELPHPGALCHARVIHFAPYDA
jgi:hypothetical protein